MDYLSPLVRLRQQVRAAERQIDIETSFRAALVPNLVGVVQAFLRHEHDLLAGLTAIRAGASLGERVAGEASTVAATRSVLAHRHSTSCIWHCQLPSLSR